MRSVLLIQIPRTWGFPLLALVFGPISLTPTTIAAILTACVLFACAVVLMEIGLLGQGHKNPLLTVARSLAKIPIIISPLFGALFAASGLSMPSSLDTAFRLLGDAASPCALVSLGAFLADRAGDGNTRRRALNL